jgi:hypothetical protein
MFCFVEDNKIISGFRKCICGSGIKKGIFNTLPVVMGYRPGNNLLCSPHMKAITDRCYCKKYSQIDLSKPNLLRTVNTNVDPKGGLD